MNIEEIIIEYDRVNKGGDNITEILKFKKLLLSDNSLETRNLHYELLRKHENRKLYQHIRAAFIARSNIEEFILEKLTSEKDEVMLADNLHILGRIRSPHAVLLARQFVNSKDNYQREVALYVLGWVGGKDEIKLLQEHMLNEEDPHLRITAASAHRQIAGHYTDLKDDVLKSLKVGFENEKDDTVLSWIIVMLGTVAVKNFGMREDKEDPYVLHGDLEKAKNKTRKFIETI